MSGNLSHSPADVVRYLLVNLGLGVRPNLGNWPIHISQEPDRPDNCVTVYDTAGRDGGRTWDGERQVHHGVQIRVRSTDFTTGHTKARAIANGLDIDVLRDEVTIGAVTYIVQNISRTTDVLSIGKEVPESKREVFTINAVVSLRQLG